LFQGAAVAAVAATTVAIAINFFHNILQNSIFLSLVKTPESVYLSDFLS
jgi:hypothetical protein